MPIPHEKTTRETSAVDAAGVQLAASVQMLSEKWQDSISHVTLPSIDPGAEFDLAAYWQSLIDVSKAYVDAGFTWVEMLTDNAVLLTSNIPVRWVSEIFPLRDFEDQVVVQARWHDEDLLGRTELEQVSDHEARVLVVSPTSHVSELELTLRRRSADGTLDAPHARLVSMSVDFRVAPS